jgi:hypothetical protein
MVAQVNQDAVRTRIACRSGQSLNGLDCKAPSHFRDVVQH